MLNFIGRSLSMLVILTMTYLYINQIIADKTVRHDIFLGVVVFFGTIYWFLGWYKKDYQKKPRIFDYIGTGTKEEDDLLFNNWYMRLIWYRGLSKELLFIFVLACAMPWDWFYSFTWYSDYVALIANVSVNINHYAENSNNPEWAQAFISFVNTIMPFTLLLSLKYANPMPGYISGRLPFSKWFNLKRMGHTLICVVPLIVGVYYIGAFTLLGLDAINYRNKIVTVLFFFVMWLGIHFFFTVAVCHFKTFLVRYRNLQWDDIYGS